MYAGKLVRFSLPELLMVMFLHLSKLVFAQAALAGFKARIKTRAKDTGKFSLIIGYFFSMRQRTIRGTGSSPGTEQSAF